MYKANDPNLASTSAAKLLQKVKTTLRSSSPESWSVGAPDRAELNKARLLRALDDPAEASKVGNLFLRHSSGEANFLGAGIESVAFSLGGGKVGKLRLRQSGTGFSGFTPPRRLKEVLQPLSRSTFDKTMVEIAPEASMGGKADDLAALDLRSRLNKRGYEWHDAAARNIGVVDGQVKVIDYGHMRKSTQYQEIRDYGMKKGFAAHEVEALVRRRSRTALAIQPGDASELRKVIDIAAANKRARALESLAASKNVTKAVMRSGSTRSGAGIVSNFIIRAAKTTL